MSKKPDGGYAFPRRLPNIKVTPDEAVDIVERYAGMSLRDYFAGQALAAMTQRPDEPCSHLAGRAYLIADAMIAAREE